MRKSSRRLEITASALRALAGLDRQQRRFLLDGLRLHLTENDPVETTRNKFQLKRPSPHAERELRLDNWRVFYSVLEDGALVIVNLIGEKRGNQLFVDGEVFEL